jgi:DNA modification methylase
VPNTVLDPFSGAGTTGLVAVRHGRRAVLVDLNPTYLALARQRLTNVQVNLLEVLA